MRVKSFRRAHKSVVGPSTITKRIVDQDSFVDFCSWNSKAQWEERIRAHRTSAIFRPDPLNLQDYDVPYSLNKGQRWTIPETIGAEIESMQDPSMALRVSAAVHSCPRSERVPLTERPSVRSCSMGPEQHPATEYHNVTREGEPQHKSAQRARLSTLEFPPHRKGARFGGAYDEHRPEEHGYLPEEKDVPFQKLHVRYTVLQMTPGTGRVARMQKPPKAEGKCRSKHRGQQVFDEDLEDEEEEAAEAVAEALREESHEAGDTASSSSSHLPRQLADFITIKVSKKKPVKKARRGARFVDELFPLRQSLQSMKLGEGEEDDDGDDYAVIEDVHLTLNEALRPEGDAETSMDFAPSCGHSWPADFWLKQVESTLAEGRSEVACMAPDCALVLTEEEIALLLSAESHRSYQRMVGRVRVREGKARACPQCRRIVVFGGSRIDACECGAQLCGACALVAHRPLKCAEAALYADYLKKSGIESLYEFTPFANRVAGLVRCPGCDVPLTREQGCDAMTCVCGAQFCFRCGGVRGDGVAHSVGACNKRTRETVILLDVLPRSAFAVFPAKLLHEAIRRRMELNARKREVRDSIKHLPVSEKRRILRQLTSLSQLRESSILRSRNNCVNRQRASLISLALSRFLNCKDPVEQRFARLLQDSASLHQ